MIPPYSPFAAAKVWICCMEMVEYWTAKRVPKMAAYEQKRADLIVARYGPLPEIRRCTECEPPGSGRMGGADICSHCRMTGFVLETE